jgi:biotin operon repressor
VGCNRSVSQIHALLYASKNPLAAEEIADLLGIARSNVSNSLRELQTWNIIRSVPIRGDRRTFYTAETDLWNLVSRIAAGRKARELDRKTFSSARGVGLADFNRHGRFRLPSLILEVDPPTHTRSRAALTKALSAPVMRSLREGFMAAAEGCH